jgi:hypothetical protein
MNKYDVISVVGEGAYGIVLKCKNRVREATWSSAAAHGYTPEGRLRLSRHARNVKSCSIDVLLVAGEQFLRRHQEIQRERGG